MICKILKIRGMRTGEKCLVTDIGVVVSIYVVFCEESLFNPKITESNDINSGLCMN